MEKSTIVKSVILWGGTGQAKVVRPIIEYYNGSVVAVFDDTPNLSPPFDDVPLYRGKEGFKKWRSLTSRNKTGFCVTIGNPHGHARLRIAGWLIKQELQSVQVIHPDAVIAENASLGEGIQVMAGAIIQPEVRIGKQCIINTNASVDHECLLADGVEISPGAVLCGCVSVGTNSWIGAGATVLPRIRIGNNAIVGAGAVVTRDVAPGLTVVGIPARSLSRKEKK